MTKLSKIEKALDSYGKAYSLLWTEVQANPNEFPSGALSSGTIAEYYAKKFLDEKYSEYDVSFGKGNQKSWDG